ncbi:MAG: DNA polymerase III subunit beta [Sphaerochaetaceae bacterium]|nr:DNA polymerase III subunit beta [Sphaerochaetaceae bacterium]
MKFVCQKANLLKEITLALDFTSQRNSLSIVSNVLLENYGDKLIIKATDQKVGFYSEIEVQTIEPGSTTVFCDKFLGVLRSLPEGDVQFEEKDTKLIIRPVGQTIDFQLRTIEADKFPQLQSIDDSKYFSISQSDYIEMINQTIFAISEDETRYFMNGVFFEHATDSLTMVATDGRRLSIIQRKFMEKITQFPSVIIPAKFLNLIKKMGTGEGMFDLAVTDSMVFARFDNHCIYSTLINGQFPNYKRVIPDSQTFSCRVSIQEMLDALKRVSLFVENKSKRLILDIEPTGIMLSSEESDLGAAKEIIPCEYDGDSCKLSLNYTYLYSPLRVMEGEHFFLQFSGPTKAMTVKPDPERDYFHIIMPMQPQSNS